MKPIDTLQAESLPDDEIDLLELARYLWRRVIPILTLTSIPLFILLLVVAFRGQSFADRSVEAILYIPGTIPVQPESIIRAQLIREALNNRRIQADANELVPHLEIKPGYGALNRPLELALSKLSGEQAPGRSENAADIRRRYDNLIANRDRFFTLTCHLENAPIDKTNARILLSELVRLFNEQVESRQYKDKYPLGAIDVKAIADSGPLSAFSANQLLGATQALAFANRELDKRGFNRKGYNAKQIDSRLDFVTIQLEAIISSSSRLTRFFLIELNRNIDVAKEKIRALDRALENLVIADSKGVYTAASGSSAGDKSLVATEYNAELFDKFLTVGAELSLVDYQEDLVKERLDLEFELARNQELRQSLGSIQIQEDSLEEVYRNLVDEVISLATLLNGYLGDYERHYMQPAVDLITLNNQRPASLLTPKTVGLLTIAAFGLSVIGLLLKRAFA